MFTAAKILLSCLCAHVLYYSVLSATRPLVNQRQTFARSFSPPLLLFFRVHFSLSLSLSSSYESEEVMAQRAGGQTREHARMRRPDTRVT